MRTPAIVFNLFLLVSTATVTGCHWIHSRDSKAEKPVRSDIETVQKGLSYPVFRTDQMIVFFKRPPTVQQVTRIKQALQEQGIDTTLLRIQRCTACGSPIELWEADSIHTVINTEGISSGSGRKSKGVGEDSLARYSVNFTSQLPVDALPNLRGALDNFNTPDTTVSGAGKDTIRIAVLDTGIDTTRFVSGRYVWKNGDEAGDGADKDHNCYKDDIAGWNFFDNTSDIRDNSSSIHGTIISQYIINQFKASTVNTVQIMALKTHDSNGFGDLFGSLCALYYAMDKGAKIINASWGFYNYGDSPVPYLDSIITQVLPTRGILFVTAAGNKIDQDDALAKQIYQDSLGIALSDADLRNLQIHNFYPACLSAAQNNVLVVTTTNSHIVSPTQNHSDRFVDLGIQADSVSVESMWFKLPFVTGNPIYVRGSSFATAIASGRIGAQLAKSSYAPGLEKTAVFQAFAPGLLRSSFELQHAHLIRDGRYAAGSLISF